MLIKVIVNDSQWQYDLQPPGWFECGFALKYERDIGSSLSAIIGGPWWFGGGRSISSLSRGDLIAPLLCWPTPLRCQVTALGNYSTNYWWSINRISLVSASYYNNIIGPIIWTVNENSIGLVSSVRSWSKCMEHTII